MAEIGTRHETLSTGNGPETRAVAFKESVTFFLHSFLRPFIGLISDLVCSKRRLVQVRIFGSILKLSFKLVLVQDLLENLRKCHVFNFGSGHL